MLFNLRPADIARTLNWEFGDANMNVAARRMLSHLDQLFYRLAESGWVFLTTVENDAETGRFPEVLRTFFLSNDIQTMQRCFVDSMDRRQVDLKRIVGRLTFELRGQGRLTSC